MALIDTNSLAGQNALIPASPLAGLSGVPAPGITSTPLPVSPGAVALANTPQATPAPSVKAGLSDEDLKAISTNTPQRFGHFASALGKALDKPELQQNLNKPGGWAKSLVAGAQNVLAGLGNVSTEKVNPGGGALEGVTRTMANINAANRQKQLDQQKQTQLDKENKRADAESARQDAAASMATENAMMLHDQRVNSNLEDGRTNTIKSGKTSIQPYLDAHAPILHTGVDSDNINQMIRDNHLNPAMVHAFPDGEAPAGPPDKNGITPMRVTYTVLGDTPNVTVNDETAPKVDGLPLSEYLSKWSGQNVPNGQFFTGLQYGQLIQKANTAETVQRAADENRIKLGLEKESDDQAERTINSAPQFSEALSNTKDLLGAVEYLKRPDQLKKNPNGPADFIRKYFGDESKDSKDATGMKAYSTDLEKRNDEIAKEADEKAKLAAEESKRKADAVVDAPVPFTNEMAANINSLPADKQAVLKSYPQDIQAILYTLAQNDGTLDIDKIFPNRRYKGSQDLALQQAMNVAVQLNPKFNAQNYRQMGIVLRDLSPGGKDGQAIQNYNNVLKHSAELQDVMAASNRQNAPEFLIQPLNWLEKHGYSTEVANIVGAEEPLKDEFSLLMSSGYKPSESMQEAYNEVISKNSTPAQISQGLKRLAATGIVRLDSMNGQYKTLAGKNIPNIIDPGAFAAAKHLGLEQADPGTWQRISQLNSGGTWFNTNPNGEPPKQQATPQLPPQALSQLQEGHVKTFANGQQWTLRGGKPVQIGQ